MEDDRLDPEEIGSLAGAPSNTKVKKKVVNLGKGRKFEIRTIIRQVITPEGEIVEESETESKMLDCGHQTSDPSVVRLCSYKECLVCEQCIVFCENLDCLTNCHTKGICKHCAIQYKDEEGTFHLCPDCANYVHLQEMKQSLFGRFKRLFRKKQEKEESHDSMPRMRSRNIRSPLLRWRRMHKTTLQRLRTYMLKLPRIPRNHAKRGRRKKQVKAC